MPIRHLSSKGETHIQALVRDSKEMVRVKEKEEWFIYAYYNEKHDDN